MKDTFEIMLSYCPSDNRAETINVRYAISAIEVEMAKQSITSLDPRVRLFTRAMAQVDAALKC